MMIFRAQHKLLGGGGGGDLYEGLPPKVIVVEMHITGGDRSSST